MNARPTQRSVADVLGSPSNGLCRPHQDVRMPTFDRLHPGLLVEAEPTSAQVRKCASAQVRRSHGRGRGRIGRRCGCLPGAWVETGHAALPGPGPNHGCSRLPHEPKRRENPLQRPGASTTRPPWPVDPEPAPPAGSHTAGRSVQRGRVPPSRSDGR